MPGSLKYGHRAKPFPVDPQFQFIRHLGVTLVLVLPQNNSFTGVQGIAPQFTLIQLRQRRAFLRMFLAYQLGVGMVALSRKELEKNTQFSAWPR